MLLMAIPYPKAAIITKAVFCKVFYYRVFQMVPYRAC